MKMILFFGRNRKVIYFPYQKKLLTLWYGKITEEEYADHLDYLEEVIEHYEIKHFVFDTKKAKSHFFKPSFRFIEHVLQKAVRNGAEKLTMVQKSFGNRQEVEDYYKTAMDLNNMNLSVSVIEPKSLAVQNEYRPGHHSMELPAQFTAQQLQSKFRPMFG